MEFSDPEFKFWGSSINDNKITITVTKLRIYHECAIAIIGNDNYENQPYMFEFDSNGEPKFIKGVNENMIVTNIYEVEYLGDNAYSEAKLLEEIRLKDDKEYKEQCSYIFE
jgi:hypothetical protein